MIIYTRFVDDVAKERHWFCYQYNPLRWGGQGEDDKICHLDELDKKDLNWALGLSDYQKEHKSPAEDAFEKHIIDIEPECDVVGDIVNNLVRQPIFAFARNENERPHFYIPDYYSPKFGLIIEIDGKDNHHTRLTASHDMVRDGEFLRFGIETVRFAAREVFGNNFVNRWLFPRLWNAVTQGYIEGCSEYMSEKIEPEHHYSELGQYRLGYKEPKRWLYIDDE